MRFYTNRVGVLLALLPGAYGVSVEQMEGTLDAITSHKFDDIRGNVHLPSTTPDGLKVSWSSSDADVISSDGRVTRQPGTTAVSLTASISSEDGSALERTFNASVRAAVQLDEFEGYAFSYFVDSSLAGEKFYLFADEYVGRGYIPLQTDDISSPDWQVPGSYNLPSSLRHGTVLPVTAAELSALRGEERRDTPRARPAHDLQKRQTEGVLPGYYADPNIAVFDGGCNYYIYATSDGYDGWGGKEFYVWSSPDLASWTRGEEPILVLDGENGTVPWATGNAWAPTIAERDGRYYFYFSGHNPTYDDKTMGVAVSDSPLGPFVAHPEPIVTGTEDVATSGGSIDPHVLRDPESGEYYLYWGNGAPVYARLNNDMVSVDWSTAAGQDGLTDYREASFVNYRDGVYHMTYSVDDTRSEDYRVGYATGPSPHGPWTYRGVVLEKDVEQGLLATGHSSIVKVPGTDEWYIAYHRFGVPGGDGTHREVTIDRVMFDGKTGLMERVVPTLGGVEARVIPGCEARRAVGRSWTA